MGDVGYLDEQGRLWFCGRKADRVRTARGTLFSVPCEAVFETDPRVHRAALVGLPGEDGAQEPVLCVEPLRRGARAERTDLERCLREIAQRHSHTREIGTFLFHRDFPVDIRHNAKIDRPALARWATRRRRGPLARLGGRGR
jgi:acyl-CoA synthetase (AMP-forming)/AMP-acid ligase II